MCAIIISTVYTYTRVKKIMFQDYLQILDYSFVFEVL